MSSVSSLGSSVRRRVVFGCVPWSNACPGSFGIGTWLTNDFKKKSSGYKEQSKALNIVIKLGSIDGKECVKISDEITKVGYIVNIRFVVSLIACF